VSDGPIEEDNEEEIEAVTLVVHDSVLGTAADFEE
jgi:hypothetical protein